MILGNVVLIFFVFVGKVKFDMKLVRHCITGYFRGFAEKMKLNQDISRGGDGIILQQHRFQPFAAVQVLLLCGYVMFA